MCYLSLSIGLRMLHKMVLHRFHGLSSLARLVSLQLLLHGAVHYQHRPDRCTGLMLTQVLLYLKTCITVWLIVYIANFENEVQPSPLREACRRESTCSAYAQFSFPRFGRVGPICLPVWCATKPRNDRKQPLKQPSS